MNSDDDFVEVTAVRPSKKRSAPPTKGGKSKAAKPAARASSSTRPKREFVQDDDHTTPAEDLNRWRGIMKSCGGSPWQDQDFPAAKMSIDGPAKKPQAQKAPNKSELQTSPARTRAHAPTHIKQYMMRTRARTESCAQEGRATQ